MAAVFLAGGGTGGHVTPALATAAALQAARPDLEIAFVGTARGLESRLVPAAGWQLHAVEAAPFRRRLSLDALRLPFVVGRAAIHVRRLLRRHDAVAAVVFGGYVSGPLALAARLARLPLVIHEQNATPGLANRIAARWAAAVAVSVPDAQAGFPAAARVTVTGNPVRADVAGSDLVALRPQALDAFGLEPGRRTLLVFGGSLGAQRLNDAVIGSAARWRAPDTVQVLHVAGQRDHERAARAWDEAAVPGLLVRCLPFVERMDLAYAAADVVLCRAGASTIAELAVTGKPSVLVPYPHAAADEQTANARALAERDAAVLIADADLNARTLVDAVEPLLDSPERLRAMSAAARAVGLPDAAERLAELVLSVCGERLSAPLGDVREDGGR